jgi:hypothetical protein
VVPEKGAWTFDPELAFFAEGHFDPFWGHEFYNQVREGRAVGTKAYVPFFLFMFSVLRE